MNVRNSFIDVSGKRFSCFTRKDTNANCGCVCDTRNLLGKKTAGCGLSYTIIKSHFTIGRFKRRIRANSIKGSIDNY